VRGAFWTHWAQHAPPSDLYAESNGTNRALAVAAELNLNVRTNMTHQELFDSIQSVFRTVFEDRALVITRDTTAEDVQGWDSFAHVNLILELENSFGLKFRLAELQELQCVGDVFDIIAKKVGVSR
jgi:acyl carrier protein